MKTFRKRLTTELVVSLITIGVLVIGLLFFGFNVGKFTKKIVAARQELAERATSLQSLAILRSEYSNKGEPYLNVLYNIIPLKDELIDLSKDFQSLAASERLDYGFTFVGETPATPGNLGSVRFSLSLGGSLNQLIDFIENLQNFRYLINLENIAMSGGASQTSMDIKGSVFFR
ncbi:MAG: hypothetical protein KJI72_03775 [Patescibacteria group bacterium]|nr:hypothetical protein [Patescibacteria group bacterium]